MIRQILTVLALLTLSLSADAAAPVIAGTNTYSTTTAATTHAVNLPASISNGELLVIFGSVIVDGTETSISATGWNLRFNDTPTNGPQIFMLDRQADGSEGSTITVTVGASETLSAYSARITGAELITTQAPETSAIGSGFSAAPDSPNLSPAGQPKDYLFFDIATHDFNAITTNGDTDFVSVNAGFGAPKLGKAHNSSQTGAYDPAAFGAGGSSNWSSLTIAIHPSAGGGGTVVNPISGRGGAAARPIN